MSLNICTADMSVSWVDFLYKLPVRPNSRRERIGGLWQGCVDGSRARDPGGCAEANRESGGIVTVRGDSPDLSPWGGDASPGGARAKVTSRYWRIPSLSLPISSTPRTLASRGRAYTVATFSTWIAAITATSTAPRDACACPRTSLWTRHCAEFAGSTAAPETDPEHFETRRSWRTSSFWCELHGGAAKVVPTK